MQYLSRWRMEAIATRGSRVDRHHLLDGIVRLPSASCSALPALGAPSLRVRSCFIRLARSTRSSSALPLGLTRFTIVIRLADTARKNMVAANALSSPLPFLGTFRRTGVPLLPPSLRPLPRLSCLLRSSAVEDVGVLGSGWGGAQPSRRGGAGTGASAPPPPREPPPSGLPRLSPRLDPCLSGALSLFHWPKLRLALELACGCAPG